MGPREALFVNFDHLLEYSLYFLTHYTVVFAFRGAMVKLSFRDRVTVSVMG